MTWDAEGRLETSTDAAGQTTFIYDADGNRLVRRDPAGRTLYLGGVEIRFAGGATASTRYYTFGGATVAMRNRAGLSWCASDHQGTSVLSVDAGTQRATVRRQTPYGALRGAAVAWPTDKGFVGGTNDNTGLTTLGARQYDTALGRFISLDPVLDLLDPQQVNGYSYGNNSPITLSDPTGLKFDDESGADYAKRLEKHRAEQEAKVKPVPAWKGKSWTSFSKPTRHNAAVRAAAAHIATQVMAMGGDPNAVRLEYPVADGCKKKHKGTCDDAGKADIVYIDRNADTIYVWEVKSLGVAFEAEPEVKGYLKKLQGTRLDQFGAAKKGWRLGEIIPSFSSGTAEGLAVTDIINPLRPKADTGGIVYQSFRVPKPQLYVRYVPVPAKVPVRQGTPEKKGTDNHPWLVPVGVLVTGAVIVGGICVIATAGVCGIALGAGGASLATSMPGYLSLNCGPRKEMDGRRVVAGRVRGPAWGVPRRARVRGRRVDVPTLFGTPGRTHGPVPAGGPVERRRSVLLHQHLPLAEPVVGIPPGGGRPASRRTSAGHGRQAAHSDRAGEPVRGQLADRQRCDVGGSPGPGLRSAR
jgi:RHS repeat-associated protein